MEEVKIKDIGRLLISEDAKWFIYSYYFEGKISAIDFLELIKKHGILKLLKLKGIYKQTGARHTKKTFIDAPIQRFLILRTNAKEYATSILNLTDLDVLLTDKRYERNECVYVELIKKLLEDVCEVELQYQVLDFRIDMYIPDYKIAIEFDEKSHFFSNKKIKEDEIRQLLIETNLDCQFFRIDERLEVLPQIDELVKNIIKIITGNKPIVTGRFITENCLDVILDIVTDFDLYFMERNKAATGNDCLLDITLYERNLISELEEKLAFCIDMNYITSFSMLLEELRKLLKNKQLIDNPYKITFSTLK